ncbi:hypothetical protein G4V62_18495 [Bacillaceae bacterium SIJ1]|uniref:hypothetical protein n=1 Tax=Litoribacterium kuwaitense TaxID=1398745 RepID=UPI0013EC6C5E|nr:hypothetical protein [Litoribacterium kuwaitense]NGP46831.1 hypothetical protein [Litoribacterium kuwaitense]
MDDAQKAILEAIHEMHKDLNKVKSDVQNLEMSVKGYRSDIKSLEQKMDEGFRSLKTKQLHTDEDVVIIKKAIASEYIKERES